LLKIFSEIIEAPISQKEKKELIDDMNASLEFLSRLNRRMIKNVTSDKIPSIK